jgi:hypothetical protein
MARRRWLVLCAGALAVLATGCRTGPAARPAASTTASRSSPTSAEARERVRTFVDETVAATTAGLAVTDAIPLTADTCSRPGDSHSWTYARRVPVHGARATDLARAVRRYWEARGYTVEDAGTGLYVRFDGFNFGVTRPGPDGSLGVDIGGSSPCIAGKAPH